MYLMNRSVPILFLAGCLAASLTAQQPAPTASASAADRSKALSALFTEIWEDRLKHSPEFASSLGDKRYNDQLTDYSVAEINASLARGRVYLDRLSVIDVTGLSAQEVLSRDIMLRQLTDAQEAARFKEWEMPVSQYNGFHTDLPM